MAYERDYWGNKEERAQRAARHTEQMQERYQAEIEKSAARAKVYAAEPVDYVSRFSEEMEEQLNSFEILVEDMDTVTALFEYEEGRTAVLNFASYQKPGGGFPGGSKAQEEWLCHDSFLYNVLQKHEQDYYAWNRQHVNQSLYRDRALYTPDVRFFRAPEDEQEHPGTINHLAMYDTEACDSTLCDVITCAAPNKAAAQQKGVSREENLRALASRIKFILDIAEEQGVETLILGAFGCGVFGQDPSETAWVFRQCLDAEKRSFKKVIFAIPKESSVENYESFCREFYKGSMA